MVNHWWTEALQEQVPQFEELTGTKVNFEILAEDNHCQKDNLILSSSDPCAPWKALSGAFPVCRRPVVD